MPTRPAKLAPPSSAEDLTRFRLLRVLDRAELEEVFKRLQVRRLRSRVVIAPAAPLHNQVCFVWRGWCRATIRAPSGAHVTMRTIGSGGHFGEVTAFAGLPYHPYHIITDTDALLLAIDSAEFRDLACKFPRLCEATMRSLAHAAIANGDRVFEFATLDVKLRLQAELLRLARQGEMIDGKIVIKPAPTHSVIAGQVGTTREGVTRRMRALAKEGVLENRRGEIAILNVNRLRHSVEEAAGQRASYGQPAVD